MRTWVKNHPSKKNHERSPGFDILKIAPKTEVSFEFHFEANPVSKQLKMVRFPENPEPEWGPKARYCCLSILSCLNIFSYDINWLH